MSVLPSPQSSPVPQEQGIGESMAILLSAVCMLSSVFAFQTGDTGKSTGKKESHKTYRDPKAK